VSETEFAGSDTDDSSFPEGMIPSLNRKKAITAINKTTRMRIAKLFALLFFFCFLYNSSFSFFVTVSESFQLNK